MVLPMKNSDGSFVKDKGSIVFTEQERDPALNKPSTKAS
jgi:hypothetical protein